MATDPARTLDAGTSVALAADELATDPDDDLDAGSLAVTTRPSNGTSEVGGGVLRYTPADAWSGDDAVRYEVCDRTGLCAAGTVHLTVRPVADPPVAEPVAATTRKGEPVDIDVLGPEATEDLTARVVDQPAQGRAEALDSGRLRYTPNAGFSGTDTFSYAVCDAAARCSEAPVTVTVIQVAPVAADDTATTLEDTPIAIDVLANDAAGTAPLDLTSLAVITESERGDVLVADGGLRYVPGKDLHGPDAVTYRICDEDDLCADARVGITVQPVDDAPVAVDDRAYTTAGTPVTIAVLANDHDVDGDDLHVELGPAPSTGTRTLTGDDVSFSDDGPGTVTFTYRACNAAACSASATVTVVVEAGGEEEASGTYPVATSDSATTYPNNPITVAVLDNDVLVDDAGNRLPVALAVVNPPDVGSAAVDGETVVYTPGGTDAALGVQTMTYEVCFAGTTRCAVATVSVTVVREPPPPPPPPPTPPAVAAEPPEEIHATSDPVTPSWVRIFTAAAEGDPGAGAPAPEPVTPAEAAPLADPAAGEAEPETDVPGAPPAPTDPVPTAPTVEPPPAVPPLRPEVDDPAPEAGTSPVTDEPRPPDEPLPTEEPSTAEAPAHRTDPAAAPTS